MDLPQIGWISLNRFGMGAAPGELASCTDPVGWLRSQLNAPGPGDTPLSGLPGHAAIMREMYALRAEVYGERGGDKTGRTEARAGGKEAIKDRGREIYLRECNARMLHAATTDRSFVERLVRFWSNHFTVSLLRRQVMVITGAFEREAIRPFVLGRFRDMLRAVEQHPAMLGYLDNQQSTGPDSPNAQRGGEDASNTGADGAPKRARGLNENLAREILELHTLGVDGGYSQEDVQQFAALLTGWSYAGPEAARTGAETSGDTMFRFYAARHQPGPKTLLGRTYGDGLDEGERALDDLARAPATALHVARRLAAHFISDDPPESAVRYIADRFLQTDGDLREVALALIDLPECWDLAPPAATGKLRQPDEWLIACMRALSVSAEQKGLSALFRKTGQPPFAAPSPAGWPDRATAWASPEQLLQRIEAATGLSRAAPARVDTWADAVFGPILPARTRRIALNAPDARQGAALLLLSPTMQRR